MITPGCTRKVVGPLVWTSGTNSKSTTTGDQLGFTPTPNGKLILKFSAMVVGLAAPAAEVKVARGNCIPICPLTSYPYCCALAKSCAPADLDRATFTTNKTTERVASLDRLAARCTERGMAIKSPPNAERSTQVFTLKHPQKRDQLLFLLRRQLGAEDQVEELDRVLQRQKTLVVHVGRVVLHAAQGKGFDGPVADRHHVVDHYRLEEALGLQVVHQIVGVEGRLVASRALALAEEDLLAAHLGLRRLGGIELAENVELGRRRKIQHFLDIGHEVDLAAALQRVHPFLRGDPGIAAGIGGALLE